MPSRSRTTVDIGGRRRQSSLAAPFLEGAIAAARLGCLRLVLAPEENGGTEWPDRSPRQMVVPSRSAPELIRVGVGM
ncbi:hypothetical protein SDJN03_14584, partial [Cucurbita argyrosperma subsp. sororia]